MPRGRKKLSEEAKKVTKSKNPTKEQRCEEKYQRLSPDQKKIIDMLYHLFQKNAEKFIQEIRNMDPNEWKGIKMPFHWKYPGVSKLVRASRKRERDRIAQKKSREAKGKMKRKTSNNNLDESFERKPDDSDNKDSLLNESQKSKPKPKPKPAKTEEEEEEEEETQNSEVFSEMVTMIDIVAQENSNANSDQKTEIDILAPDYPKTIDPTYCDSLLNFDETTTSEGVTNFEEQVSSPFGNTVNENLKDENMGYPKLGGKIQDDSNGTHPFIFEFEEVGSFWIFANSTTIDKTVSQNDINPEANLVDSLQLFA